MLRTPPYLPSFQFHEAHELTCAGNPQQLLQAILTQNLRQDPLIGFFMALRERVPGIFLGVSRHTTQPQPQALLGLIILHG